MANVYRYRHGATRPRSLAFKAAVAVQIGDCCFRDASDSYTLKPASSYTYQSTIATPSAPTVANTTTTLATGLTNAATGVKVSYNFPWGEGALSNAGSATPTANAGILLSGVALPDPVISRNIYVETAAASGTYKLWGVDFGGNTVITGYGIGRVPPTAVATTALEFTQYLFHNSFAGVAAQQYDGTNANIYGVKDGMIRFDPVGVFEFDCASATFKAGDLVGMAKASGSNLENQKVVAVAHELLAIGRVYENATTVTTVKVDIRSILETLLS